MVSLTHLSFPDDLMIFYAVEWGSLQFVRDTLCYFERLAKLKANVGKSSIFLASVDRGCDMNGEKSIMQYEHQE